MKRKRDPIAATQKNSRSPSDSRPLAIKPVPIPVGATHPPVPHDSILPMHEFTMGVVAPKGSGKTTWIANLLDFYAGYFHTILVFSPTIYSDEKWDYVRKRPLLAENKALRKFLEKKKKSDNAVIEDPHIVTDSENKKFDPHIPDDCFMTEYSPATLAQLMQEQDDKIEEIQKMGGTKHLANRCLHIYDDLVGSSLFSTTRDNPFKVLNTRHRHLSTSIIMVSQAYKELPKTVRTNFTGMVLFEVPSEGELNAIYEENPVGHKREVWDQIYKFCTEDEYAFMYINTKRPKPMRIMRNFDQFVFME